MIQVLEKAATILRLVASRENISFSDVRTQLGMNKATLSHILKTLTELQLLERLADGRFRIGPNVLALAKNRLRQDSLAEAAEHAARQLAEEIRECVTVSTLRHHERFVLAKAVVTQAIAVDTNLEQRPSPYTSATGRVLLACAEAAEREQVIKRHGLPGDAWPEVRGMKDLHASLNAIQAAGIAEVAHDGGALSVALPVRGPDGRVWLSVGVGAPAFRMQGKDRQRKLDALRQAARRMEDLLALRHASNTPLASESERKQR